MQTQAVFLLLALGLAACGETPPAPPAVPAAPRRAASEPEATSVKVVLVAPASEPGAPVSLVEAPAAQALSTPASYKPVQAPTPSSTARTNGGSIAGRKGPLVRDRKGKVMGRGPRRGERPSVGVGSPNSKYFTPARGRKVRNRDGHKSEAKPAKDPVEQPESVPDVERPHR